METTLIYFLNDYYGNVVVPLNVERITSFELLKERLIKLTYGDLFRSFIRTS